MKRTRAASAPRNHEIVVSDLPLDTELMQSGRLDMRLPIHGVIWNLAGRLPSANCAQEWKAPSCTELLQECSRLDWVGNFGHIATLFGITALTNDIPSPSPELMAHLLLSRPQIVDMAIEGFCADGEQIPMLHKALSETNHLRHFDFTPEDIDPGVGLAIVQGLRSHHHLASWRHWTDDDPDTFVPELAQTLSGMQNLQRLDLSIAERWGAEHFEDFACRLMQMPALRNLRLDIARASTASTRATASALIRAIAALPRLMSLCVSRHVFLAMDPADLIRAVRQNGAIDTLSVLDVDGGDVPVELSSALVAALRTNRNRFDIAPVPMMGPACSAFVNVVLAQYALGPVSDIGNVVAVHLVGPAAAPDLRDCQGLLRVSKPIWDAARAMRRQAMLQLLAHPSTKQAMSLSRLHLVGLCAKFNILGVEDLLRLTELHTHWLTRNPPALQ